MCGITGFYGFEDQKLLKEMASMLHHRGPDDTGYYTDKTVSLGHKRLSIIDLSENGKQPMHNEDESIWIVFNGEIYNFHELRADLEKKGHRFYSNTDTESIIHAYEEYGYNCVKLFNGMFAFAIWDSNKKELVIARDRFGEKPLYYTIDKGRIIFSSEIKSLLLYEGLDKRINMQAVSNFLDLRFIPGPDTIFCSIHKLQPAHMLVWKNNKAEISQYWDLNMQPEDLSEERLVAGMRKEIESAVRKRMISDVPIGAFLSGGIDSSSIVAYMAKFSEEPVKTYSVTFGHEQQKQEMNYARLVAEHFKTEHKEIYVDVDTFKVLPKVIWHLDEPMSDATAIPTYLLSENIKPYATVVLTGDGGDELFAGYEQQKFMMLFDAINRAAPNVVTRKVIPFCIKCTPKPLLDKLFKYSSSLGEGGICRFRKIIGELNQKDAVYSDLLSIFTEEEKKELFKDSSGIGCNNLMAMVSEYLNDSKRNELLNNMLKFEMKTVLPDDYLMKVDKTSSAHAVEVRAPLLDPVLAEFSGKIPPKMKLRGFNEKYILKKAMIGIVPMPVIKRKKDRFFVPIDDWLKGDLKDIAEVILSESNCAKSGYFNHKYIQKAFKGYGKSKLYYSRQLWNLLNFEIWYKMFVNENLKKPVGLDRLF